TLALHTCHYCYESSHSHPHPPAIKYPTPPGNLKHLYNLSNHDIYPVNQLCHSSQGVRKRF
ncbi:hypothetical protein B9Z19DRAFT_1074482, partial [Tuber borchii]